MSDSASHKIEEILKFWFGHVPGRRLSRRGARQILRRLPMWAGNWGRRFFDVDREIRLRFSGDLRRAEAGACDDWASTPTGRLALLLLLDQFSRNIHRGTPAAFANDAKSLRLALEALEQGEDKLFYPVVRSFFYLPLEHQEDIVYQDRAVAAFNDAVRDAGSGLQCAILMAERFSAGRHREAIQRFGRFPHRNRILGRSSSVAELRFLRQPFTRF
jgi:uncharacterized protein (DUF924 family)